MAKLTHIDESGAAHMVDVSDKANTARAATASARVLMQPATLELIASGLAKKGDVLGVARIAGIQAAKRCSELIPLCHPLMLTAIDVDLSLDPAESCVRIEATCRLAGQTGVEMEALTAASVAALTVYDMCKAADRGMVITDVMVQAKRGGKSGDWVREAPGS